MPEIIAAGHLCVDIIPRIPPGAASGAGWLAPGRLTEVGEAVLTTGGSASNTGLALHKLGVDVRLVARLGDDLLGHLIGQIIAGFDPHLAESFVIAQGEASSYTIVISPPGVDRCFLHCPGTNHTFGPEDVSEELLARTQMLHFGYPPLMRRMYERGGRALAELFRRAKERGATTSLDLVMPDPAQPGGQADWRAILARTLPHVDIFAPSLEELLYMLDRPRFDALEREAAGASLLDLASPELVSDLAADALALGAQMVMIKLGHRGLYLRSGAMGRALGRGAPADVARWRERELWAPALRVAVVGTVGAGDATIAGFLTAILRGQGPEEAAISAAAVGACNVEAADATSGVRSWQETQARLAAPWERLDAGIASGGWRPDAGRGLWRGPRDLG